MTDTASFSLWRRLRYTRLRDALRFRIDGRLDWRHVVATAGLPEDLADKTRQVVRRTRLWRAEKVDVARELVAHFQDGLDAGRSAEQLADAFGDIRQTAQLIRRAKRRSRSLAWLVCHYGWWALFTLVLIYAVVGLYMLTFRPTVATDYLAIFNRRALAVPEDERAWPLYRQALAQLTVERKFPEWADHLEFGPTDPRWPAAVAWLTEHQAALALVREAAARPEMGFAVGVSPQAFSPADQRLLFEPNNAGLGPQTPRHERSEAPMLVSAHLPHLHPLLSLANVLAIDARRAALAGDGDAALADLRAMFGLAEQIEQMPCLIVTVTALRIHKKAYAVIADVLTRQPELWSPGQLRDLAHATASRELDWRRGIDGERAMFYDIIQRFYTDDGNGDGRLAFRGPGAQNLLQSMRMLIDTLTDTPPQSSNWTSDGLAALVLPAANLAVASRKEVTDAYDQLTDRAMERIETPLWTPVTTLEAETKELERGFLGRIRYMFLSTLMPAYDGLRLRFAEAEGERDGVLVGLALTSYHRETGAWPQSLEELSPRWLPEVPVDRITGDPIHYKVVDDRPVVYSVGVDRDDDGGRRKANRDATDQSVPGNADGTVVDWPPRAAPPASLASPEYFQPQPVKDPRHDGDWVIWSIGERE